MNFYIAKRTIQAFVDKYYVDGKVNPKLRKDEFNEIIKANLTKRQAEIINAAWDTNPKEKRQNTTREAAEIAHCSMASVYQNVNRALTILSKPKCKIVLYPNNQRVSKEKVFEGPRYKSMTLAYITEGRKTEEVLRLYADGRYETLTIHDGTTVSKEKGMHGIPIDKFQSYFRPLYHELPFMSPHRYQGPAAALKVSLYDRRMRTTDIVYFTKDNIKYFPKKYLDEIRYQLPIEHPFFTEADKATENIELESFMRHLFPKATDEQLQEIIHR